MFDVKQMVADITKEKEVKNISFVGCGGSLACFYSAYYYVTRESEKLAANYCPANEFVRDTPKNIGENSVVVIASRRGNTAETVEAGRVAKKLGAKVIGLAYEKDTVMETVADQTIHFNDGADAAYEDGKAAYALQIAFELVHEIDHNEHYDAMVAGVKKMNELVPKAVEKIIPEAIQFSIAYKADKNIYTMGSGTAWAAAQQQTICIFMEMQWINSSVIHTGEFFHGPFEITDPDTAFLFLKSTGKTRDLDERALKFLNKYNHHLTVIDGKDYGMDELGEVSEYFDYDLYTAVLGVYNHLLADMRDHPLNKRKYMWKFDY